MATNARILLNAAKAGNNGLECTNEVLNKPPWQVIMASNARICLFRMEEWLWCEFASQVLLKLFFKPQAGKFSSHQEHEFG
jgi:hypothetical protein